MPYQIRWERADPESVLPDLCPEGGQLWIKENKAWDASQQKGIPKRRQAYRDEAETLRLHLLLHTSTCPDCEWIRPWKPTRLGRKRPPGYRKSVGNHPTPNPMELSRIRSELGPEIDFALWRFQGRIRSVTNKSPGD